MSEETKDDMTPAQWAAVCKAWDILSEHFEHALLVVDWDVEGTDGKQCNAHEGYWSGGALTAVGMALFAQERIMRSSEKTNEPE